MFVVFGCKHAAEPMPLHIINSNKQMMVLVDIIFALYFSMFLFSLSLSVCVWFFYDFFVLDCFELVSFHYNSNNNNKWCSCDDKHHFRPFSFELENHLHTNSVWAFDTRDWIIFERSRFATCTQTHAKPN